MAVMARSGGLSPGGASRVLAVHLRRAEQGRAGLCQDTAWYVQAVKVWHAPSRHGSSGYGLAVEACLVTERQAEFRHGMSRRSSLVAAGSVTDRSDVERQARRGKPWIVVFWCAQAVSERCVEPCHGPSRLAKVWLSGRGSARLGWAGQGGLGMSRSAVSRPVQVGSRGWSRPGVAGCVSTRRAGQVTARFGVSRSGWLWRSSLGSFWPDLERRVVAVNASLVSSRPAGARSASAVNASQRLACRVLALRGWDGRSRRGGSCLVAVSQVPAVVTCFGKLSCGLTG